MKEKTACSDSLNASFVGFALGGGQADHDRELLADRLRRVADHHLEGAIRAAHDIAGDARRSGHDLVALQFEGFAGADCPDRRVVAGDRGRPLEGETACVGATARLMALPLVSGAQSSSGPAEVETIWSTLKTWTKNLWPIGSAECRQPP